MEISKPMKSVLSLRRCSLEFKGNIRNKITFSASSQNNNGNTDTDLTKSNNFSSRLKFKPPIPNCIQILKNVASKPIVSSQTVTQRYMGNSLSHMPVYHKVIALYETQ